MATRSKGELKRLQIVECAISLMANQGIGKAKAAGVAKELSIQPSLVFYHFKTQELLFEAMIKHIAFVFNDYVVRALESATGSTKSKLIIYFNASLNWATENPAHVACLIYGMSTSQNQSPVSEVVTKAMVAGEQRLSNMIAEGLMLGEISVENGKLATKMIHDCLTATIIKNFIAGESSSEEGVEKLTILMNQLISKE